MKFTEYKKTPYKKYLREVFIEEYIKEGQKSYSRHFDEIFEDTKIYRKSWLKLAVILLEELKQVCEEKNVKPGELVVYMNLKSKEYKLGMNFKNQKELINEVIDWEGTPSLVISSFKVFGKNKKIKKFELEDFSNPKITLFFIEEHPNQWNSEFNRTVYLSLKHNL